MARVGKTAVRAATALGVAATLAASQVAGQDSLQQTAAPEELGCFVAPAGASDSVVAEYLADPAALLVANPTGGLALSDAVRSLAGSSSAAFRATMDLTSAADSAQNAAIGAGLMRAVVACRLASQNYAVLMQQAVIDLGNEEVLTAFTAAMSDVQMTGIEDAEGGLGVESGRFSVGAAGNFIVRATSPVTQ